MKSVRERAALVGTALLILALETSAVAAPSSQPTSRQTSTSAPVEQLGGQEEDWPDVSAAPTERKAAAVDEARLVDWRALTRLTTATDLRHEGERAGAFEDVGTLTWILAGEAAAALPAGFHLRVGGRLRLFLSWREGGEEALHRSDFELLPADSYLAWRRGSFEARLGMQTVIWGGNDLVNPLDVLAPRDLRLGLLTEPEATRLPTFALTLRGRVLSTSVDLLWAPIFSPHRVDLFGSDFAVLGPGAPAALRPIGAALEKAIEDSREGALQAGLLQTELPRPVVGSDLGLRVSRSLRGTDVALHYVFTHQRLPALAVHRYAVGKLVGILSREGSLSDTPELESLLAALLDTEGGLSIRYPRQHVLGATVSRVLGPFVGTLDIAYRSRQLEPLASDGPLDIPLVVSDRQWWPTTIESKALAYTVGLRHSHGEELLLLLEWWHELLLDEVFKEEEERRPLLMGGPQRGGLAALLRFTRHDFSGQFLLHGELFFGSLVFSPEISYRLGDHLLLGLGLNLFVGQRGVGALYQSNDQVYAYLRGDL